MRGAVSVLLFILCLPGIKGNTCPLSSYQLTLIATDDWQDLKSPFYNSTYPINLECEWTIQSSDPQEKIVLITVDMDLEISAGMCMDYIEVFDGVRWMGSYCNRSSVPVITTNGPSLRVRFVSDYSIGGRGFFLQYRLIPSTNASAVPGDEVLIQTCAAAGFGVDAQGSSRYILSPNYPSPYPPNTDCVWTIQAPTPGHVVKIVVLESSLETSPSCAYDYVAAYDGYGVYSRQLDKWCGSETPTVYSTGPSLTLTFHSDQSNQLRGFKISFREVPASEVPWTGVPIQTCDAAGVRVEAQSWSQYILSPNYPSTYPGNRDCMWMINAPTPGYVVKIVVIDSGLEDSSTCSFDYVAAYDGSGMSDTQLKKWCGSETPTVYSSGPSLTLRFRSDGSNQQRGFKIAFQAFPASAVSEMPIQTCDAAGVRVEAELWPRYILSPSYPSFYPGNRDCMWMIHAPTPGYVVKIVVIDSGLETSSSCSFDYVAAYDADGTTSRLDKWCGSETPTVFSSGPSLTLTFHSDGSNQQRGFNISFQEVPESERPKPLSSGAIVGIVFGVCAFIVLCSVGCWYWLRRITKSTPPTAGVMTSWNAGVTATTPHLTSSTAGNLVIFTTASYTPGSMPMTSDPFAPPAYPGPVQHNAFPLSSAAQASYPPAPPTYTSAQAGYPPPPPTYTSGAPDLGQFLPTEPPPPYSMASQYEVRPGRQTGETTPGAPGEVSATAPAPEVAGGAAAPGSGQPAPGGSVNRGFLPDEM